MGFFFEDANLLFENACMRARCTALVIVLLISFLFTKHACMQAAPTRDRTTVCLYHVFSMHACTMQHFYSPGCFPLHLAFIHGPLLGYEVSHPHPSRVPSVEVGVCV